MPFPLLKALSFMLSIKTEDFMFHKKTSALLICLLAIWLPVFAQTPVFDGERAYQYLEKQCAFGPRNPGSAGHQQCLDYLVQTLEVSANQVRRQLFTLDDPKSSVEWPCANVIASFGTQKDRILLCAHWDTRPWADNDPNPQNHETPILGANDGASGVAVLLEIAELFKGNPPPVGVDIVLFDGEDAGVSGDNDTWCKGSDYFAKHLFFSQKYSAAILLDMIGDADLEIPMEQHSLIYAPQIVSRVYGIARQLGVYQFVKKDGMAMIDDHLPLLRAGIPAIDLIDFDYPYWHTIEDKPDKCSAESLEAVGSVLMEFIYTYD